MSIRPRHRNTAVTLLAAILACSGLQACQNPSDSTARGLPAENWEGPQLKTEPELQISEYRQDVRFVPGSASLAPGTEDALMAFVSGVGDRVYVIVGAADRSGLAERRSRAVGALLARNRIQSQSRFTEDDGLPVEGVAVVVQRTAVALPSCPNGRRCPTGTPKTSR